MPSDHDQLLDATISYLEQLKAQGTRFVSVSSETLAAFETASGTAPKKESKVVAAPRSSQPAAVLETNGSKPAFVQPAPPQVIPPPVSGSQLPPNPVSLPLSPEAKASAMAQLRERAQVCVKCPNLAASRKNVVFGVGDIQASIMFVG